MLDKKGFTLVESLLAFEIFITVIIMFISLTLVIHKQNAISTKIYQNMQSKEENLFYTEDLEKIIEQALH